ncbi:type III polyketide synthase [Chloroflexia bacterium SDU3-3]|nr:type III polyketide synthase [Chloroflexia bacterium SDU3-3]
MPSIRAIGTALPPHQVAQDQARDFARAYFGPAFPGIDRYMSVFAHAQIDNRAIAAPLEWFQTPRSFKECNDLFIQVATDIAQQAAEQCLRSAGLGAGDIDHLIFVTTTGLAAPSLDAMLINRMGMGPHTRRTPIWGLGCAGGVGGLARAYDYALAHPAERVLLVTSELCSLTFQWDDFSKRNLIASSLFSDGAAALLVEGDAVAQAGPRILATQSTLWPDTREVMGWDIVDTGMRVVFSPRIPHIVQTLMRDNVAELLAAHGLTLDSVAHWVLHPGGAKVVRAYEDALGIDPERLRHTRGVLRDHGNMSSSTVFFVLDRFLREGSVRPGEYGVLAVLGPGFSCELALVQG